MPPAALSDAERSMLLEDLARAPRVLAETFTHEGSARTPACGDEVTARVSVDAAGVLQQLSFAGHGCTVSMAATAALTGLAPLSGERFQAEYEHYVAAVNGDGALDGDLEPFAGIGRFPLRAQCATLAWRALENALTQPATAR